MTLIQKRLTLLFLGALLGWGCQQSDDQYGEQYTVHILKSWGEILVSVINARADTPESYKSLKEALDQGIAKGYFADHDPQKMRRDYWGRDFIWEVKDGKTIRIVSMGRNGVYDNGEEDDLVVQIWRTDSGAQMSIRLPPGIRGGPK